MEIDVAALQLDDLEDRTPRGLAGALSRAIRAGTLAPGHRLPTVRDVAARLGVSPATVSAAWQALQRTGLVVSRGRAGTFVCEPPTTWLSPRVRDLAGRAAGPGTARDAGPVRLDLSRGTPDPLLLPALGPALGRVSARAATLAYQEEPVLPALREVLAATWPDPTHTLTVVDGATDGVARVLEHLVSFGDRVVLESPGFPPFLDLVEALGAEIVPVTLDAEGVEVASLRAALGTRPVAVVLQPRAQNPTGASFSTTRAVALAEVLAGAGGPAQGGPWVVEDDHSGAISTAPAVSLGPLLPDRVVHVRSFSKSHGPDLRIAALGGPQPLVDAIVARRMLGPAWTSRMVQTILLDLLTETTSRDEVDRARDTYASRRRDLVAALASYGVHLDAGDGINLWLPVRDERAAQLHLAAAGLRAAGGAPFVSGTSGAGHEGPHLRVTAGLVTPDVVEVVARTLSEAAALGLSRARPAASTAAAPSRP